MHPNWKWEIGTNMKMAIRNINCSSTCVTTCYAAHVPPTEAYPEKDKNHSENNNCSGGAKTNLRTTARTDFAHRSASKARVRSTGRTIAFKSFLRVYVCGEGAGGDDDRSTPFCKHGDTVQIARELWKRLLRKCECNFWHLHNSSLRTFELLTWLHGKTKMTRRYKNLPHKKTVPSFVNWAWSTQNMHTCNSKRQTLNMHLVPTRLPRGRLRKQHIVDTPQTSDPEIVELIKTLFFSRNGQRNQ